MRTLEDVFDLKLGNFRERLFTNAVGKIRKYNPETQMADVQLAVRVPNSEGFIMDTVVVYDVPVMMPSGGTGSLTFPLQIDDSVLMCFTYHRINSWKYTTGLVISDPIRNFVAVDNAIAIVGLHTSINNTNPNPTDVELKFQGSSITLQADGNILIDSPKEVTVQGATKVNIIAPSIELQGDVHCTGNITSDGDVIASGISLINHTHPYIDGQGDPNVPVPSTTEKAT